MKNIHRLKLFVLLVFNTKKFLLKAFIFPDAILFMEERLVYYTIFTHNIKQENVFNKEFRNIFLMLDNGYGRKVIWIYRIVLFGICTLHIWAILHIFIHIQNQLYQRRWIGYHIFLFIQILWCRYIVDTHAPRLYMFSTNGPP